MQAIPSEIKTCVILISNEMPDEIMIQPTYRPTTFFNIMFSLTPEQGTHDDFATAFKALLK